MFIREQSHSKGMSSYLTLQSISFPLKYKNLTKTKTIVTLIVILKVPKWKKFVWLQELCDGLDKEQELELSDTMMSI